MSGSFKGAVKWFDNARGFGFIEREDGRDVFVHYSVIESDGFKTLKDGETVTYEMKEGDKGLHAVKVKRVREDSDSSEMEFNGEGTSSETKIFVEGKEQTERAKKNETDTPIESLETSTDTNSN